MAGAHVLAGSPTGSSAAHNSGRYVYVANTGSNDVSQYTIGADGSLTPMALAVVPAGMNPRSVAVDPSGRYVYVANGASNDVSQYTIGGGRGASAPARPPPAPRTEPPPPHRRSAR